MLLYSDRGGVKYHHLSLHKFHLTTNTTSPLPHYHQHHNPTPPNWQHPTPPLPHRDGWL